MSAVIDERSRVEQALSFIPADIERDRWWKVGAALKHEFGDPGFDVFDGWSRAGESYAEADIRDTWKSLKSDGGITIATLYALAKEYGFDPRQHRAAVIDPAELERRRTDREAGAARKKERMEKAAKHAATVLDAAGEIVTKHFEVVHVQQPRSTAAADIPLEAAAGIGRGE